MTGILGYGVYVPYYRLERKAIGDAQGVSAGRGTRAVASYDEDTTSMGVEAGRSALRGARGVTPAAVYFATADPGYLDKTNATAIHAALDLPPSAAAYDMAGSVRSGMGALRAALDSARPTLAVLSDLRTGLPAGADERDGGDAAAAFLCGPGSAAEPPIAELVAWASTSAEFLDRWRRPGDRFSRQWEERFGEHAYAPLAESAITSALKQAGVTGPSLASVIVAGPHGRANKRAVAATGARPEALGDDLAATVGNTGAAHAGLLLAHALDRAQADDLIMVVSLADGCDVTIWRATAALARGRQKTPVARQAAGGGKVAYGSFLTWRGFLRREPPRRPDPQPPAAPPAFRAEAWKFGFTGSRCQACGTRHLPPARVCLKCHAVDRMVPERMAEVPATIATYTVDRLAYSLSPPVVVGVLDFEGASPASSPTWTPAR
jgi:hydroxymethylglutaryl-CoA synthase